MASSRANGGHLLAAPNFPGKPAYSFIKKPFAASSSGLPKQRELSPAVLCWSPEASCHGLSRPAASSSGLPLLAWPWQDAVRSGCCGGPTGSCQPAESPPPGPPLHPQTQRGWPLLCAQSLGSLSGDRSCCAGCHEWLRPLAAVALADFAAATARHPPAARASLPGRRLWLATACWCFGCFG